MTEEIIKCVKGESCIHCGSTYCRFVDEVDELEQENKELKERQINWYNAEAQNYRSALEDIKVIADDTFKVCDDDCGNARKIKLIIDKINEVLN